MNQMELLNDQSCCMSRHELAREGRDSLPPPREREIRNYRSSFRRGADSRDVRSLGSLGVTPALRHEAALVSPVILASIYIATVARGQSTSPFVWCAALQPSHVSLKEHSSRERRT